MAGVSIGIHDYRVEWSGPLQSREQHLKRGGKWGHSCRLARVSVRRMQAKVPDSLHVTMLLGAPS